MFFDHLTLAPADPLFGIKTQFDKDLRKEKVFLTLGVYQTDKLEKKLMSAVHRAAQKIAQKDSSAEYLPIDGLPLYLSEVTKLIFGKGKNYPEKQALIYGAQTVGGTSALRLGGDFLFQHFGKEIYLSDPTWANHKKIFASCGLKINSYPYYDLKTNTIDFDKMSAFLAKLPEKSTVLLQPCCHNPTGADLSFQQWEALALLFKTKKHLAFFDFAYLGFGEGRELDTQAIRLFLEMNLEFLVAFSASKNFSLYKQRTGALFFSTASKEDKSKIASHVKSIIRANYSNPPAYGAQIVAEVLSNADLKKEWEKEIDQMRLRIDHYRQKLAEALKLKDFSYLKKQKGLFSLLGLSPEQVNVLKQSYALYLPDSSRINIAGVGSQNLEYIVSALEGVLKK